MAEQYMSLRGKLINAVVQDFYVNALGDCTLQDSLNFELNFDTAIKSITRKDGTISVNISYRDGEVLSKVIIITVDKI